MLCVFMVVCKEKKGKQVESGQISRHFVILFISQFDVRATSTKIQVKA